MRSVLGVGTAFFILHLSLLTWSAPAFSPTHTHSVSSPVTVISISTTSHRSPLSISHRFSPTAGQALQPPSSRPRHHGVTKEQHKTQKSLFIALAIIGGFTALVFFTAILRCSIKFKQAPKRDRIAEIVQRHNLDCEMDVLERNSLGVRRSSPREPAPPYIPRPPPYSPAALPSSTPSGAAEPLHDPTRTPTPIHMPETPAPASSIP